MCSIIGYSGVFDEELVERLCFNSRIRGLHSFGYSFYDKKKLVTRKFLDYKKFLDKLKDDRPNKFICHFRYSTSGDYKNEINNQPLVRENLAMVFNGVLDMRSKSKMEQESGVELISDNDGELAIIKKIRSIDAFKKFVLGRSFAGAFLTAKNEIEVYRNSNRPAYIGCYNGINILASTKDILERSKVLSHKDVETNSIIVL